MLHEGWEEEAKKEGINSVYFASHYRDATLGRCKSKDEPWVGGGDGVQHTGYDESPGCLDTNVWLYDSIHNIGLWGLNRQREGPGIYLTFI